MKPQELAKRLNIADVTLRKWAREDYAEFLSPSAQTATKSGRRAFSDQDVRVLFWIAQLRDLNTSPEAIRETLRTEQANDWRNLPPVPSTASDEVALIPREAVEERLHALQDRFDLQLQAAQKAHEAIERERDELQKRLEKTEARNTDLEQRLNAVTEQLMDLNKRLTSLLEKEQRRRK